ncbi:putative bifunctional diguanylate cyclase/phosphodiesterase [Desertibacillus haloalkaliphilus]|uniref:putative bifunctional diguanylate cyclase/phosphodiesterase n=1 Tax=Desertibacillus haloalkaliphilus TaxID=1328930 RepID=UPI001C26795B|nr:EAL domain-containing protein [Desertibacillus haloalkaliphilus]MBU8905927.1 EAL domain-containing protein [Desertibacillus haloalkaliphilus]
MRDNFERFAGDYENVWKLFNHMNDGLIITDYQKRIIAINPAYEEITGYSFDELQGKNPNFVQSGKTARSVFNEMWREIGKSGTWTGELINRRKNGEEFWSFITITHIKKKPVEDSYYIGVMRDITERKKAEAKVSHLAYHDSLTDMPNRALFLKHLKSAIVMNDSDEQKVAVIFLDLDHFKKVNDTLGHHAGDQLLQEVSRRIESVVAEKGVVSRFGGDEFTILIETLNEKSDIQPIIDKLFQALQRPFLCGGKELYITASVGVSFYPDHGEDAQELLQNADNAMYRTKDEGRNNFQFYERSMNEASLEQLQLEQDIRKAFEKDEFVVHYQLQVDIETGKPYGVEALVRWQHEKDGLVSPGKFLPVAEELGLMGALDDWVLKTACKQTKQWHEQGFKDLVISVNISQQQFETYNFVEGVKKTLAETDLKPDHLCLEITENIAVANTDEAIARLNELKGIGVRVSLDDFGTGYSSLSQLKRFPIDILKIDQSFVRESPQTTENAAIVKLIIGMAKSLNFSVICEGIETEEQLTLIKKEGCQHAQGFLFSRPIPAVKCEAMMKQMNNITG